MDTRDAYRLMMRSMGRTAELQGSGTPGGLTLALAGGGVLASITPAAPDRSVLNGVVATDYSLIDASLLDELARAYADAGVRAWTVWVPDCEPDTRELLASAGHVLDASPAAMLLELDELRAPARAPETLDWSGEWDVEAAGQVNDAAYGDEPGLFARAAARIPADTAHMYVARVVGEPASFVLVHDHERDCAFWVAATIPSARGRGLLSALLHRALLDARERGCTTSTTQATRMGEPVYERLGYRTFGRIEMWERREPRPEG